MGKSAGRFLQNTAYYIGPVIASRRLRPRNRPLLSGARCRDYPQTTPISGRTTPRLDCPAGLAAFTISAGGGLFGQVQKTLFR